MKMGFKKRGLSPVIATILLVLIAIIIAVIILLWARGFVKDAIEKSIAGKSERIENFCKDVSFSADATLAGTITPGNPKSSTTLSIGITNTGDIPIYGVQITKIDKAKGSKVNAGQLILTGGSVRSGESSVGEISSNLEFKAEDSVLIVPILIGQVKEQKTWYVCDEQYGVKEEIKA